MSNSYLSGFLISPDPLSVGHKSTEFKQLEDYLIKTHGSTHYFKFKVSYSIPPRRSENILQVTCSRSLPSLTNKSLNPFLHRFLPIFMAPLTLLCQVSDIFRIEREGERHRFSSSPYGRLGPTSTDRRLLWHGSRATNYGGILSQGLRIAPPEAPVSGYMFGKGVYLADISSKSANYCFHQQSGNNALLLLCEAELGRPMYELTGASYTAGEDAKSRGCWATWGKGRTAPRAWKDAVAVHKSLEGVKMVSRCPAAPAGILSATIRQE